MKISRSLLPGNFAKGRKGVPIDCIVIHVMEGTMQGTLEHFRRVDPPDPVSAHYGISRAGEIVQYVEDLDTAWHAGRVLNPTSTLIKDRPGLNPNSFSIGIEHEGTASSGLTLPQMAASAELIRLLCSRHRIAIDRRHIIGHREIFAGKSCPGKVNVDALVELASMTKVTPFRLNLDRIEHPTPDHISEIVRLRKLDSDEAAIGIAVAEVLLRGTVNADIARKAEVVKQAADAMSDWLRARLPPEAA